MSSQKPAIPKGTRDFVPSEMIGRNYIFDTIKSVFQLYGYQPIETPAMENLSTLLGKYGEEGDKLLFRILNSGDFLAKADPHAIQQAETVKLAGQISEKGLRYDLTVPFARFVVQHRNELTFPFKRYQIQPVWRADRPQKGRYQMIDEVFKKLHISVSVKLNNRKILAGIAEKIGEKEKLIDITVAIDKLDKTGIENVNREMTEKGISADAVQKLQPILQMQGSDKEKLDFLNEYLQDSPTGLQGISEIKEVFDYLKYGDISCNYELDLTLARGLNYYTGAIIEVKANDVQIGSICGGGRYDDLTGIFGMPGTSGVGVSFGADRIYDVMNELSLFPENQTSTTQVLFVNFGDSEAKYCMNPIKQIRNAGISCELYPESAKMKKQMGYADKQQIPFVVIVGKNEMEAGLLSVKNMKTGEQKNISITEFISQLHKG